MSPERENVLLNSLDKSGNRHVSGERASNSTNEVQSGTGALDSVDVKLWG